MVNIPITFKKGKTAAYGFYDKNTGELISTMYYKISEKEERTKEAEKISGLFNIKVRIKRI